MSEPGAASLWNATLPADERIARSALGGDIEADVAIVGAGYTGLWTAYSLKRADPTLRIVVCERETVGFGASGRNGGWCSALFAGNREETALDHGRTAVVEMQRAMFATLDEIERVIVDEGIDCDWARGGTIQVATLAAHRERLHYELERSSVVGLRCRRLPRADRDRVEGDDRLPAESRWVVHPALRGDSSRRSSCTASRGPSSGPGSRSTRTPRWNRSSRAACARTAARCAPRSWCARRRRSARIFPACGERSRRSIR